MIHVEPLEDQAEADRLAAERLPVRGIAPRRSLMLDLTEDGYALRYGRSPGGHSYYVGVELDSGHFVSLRVGQQQVADLLHTLTALNRDMRDR